MLMRWNLICLWFGTWHCNQVPEYWYFVTSNPTHNCELGKLIDSNSKRRELPEGEIIFPILTLNVKQPTANLRKRESSPFTSFFFYGAMVGSHFFLIATTKWGVLPLCILNWNVEPCWNQTLFFWTLKSSLFRLFFSLNSAKVAVSALYIRTTGSKFGSNVHRIQIILKNINPTGLLVSFG